MSLEKQEQQMKVQRQSHQASPIQISPLVDGNSQKHRGCCRGLSIIFSIVSEAHQSPHPEQTHQVDELRGEVRRLRELKAVYKSRLERMQEYLSMTRPMLTTTEPGVTHFEAIRDQANLNGWSIEPHEVEFHEKIATGTTADIYTGTWRGLGVAIKWIYPQYFQSNECGEAWFAQELDTLSRQRHPSVLRMLGACLNPPENGWIVTELLSGKTLREWLHGHKKRQIRRSISLPPLKERIDKGLEIAQAMQYLHEQKPKVIHRDLKPSNILLDDSMHVRVADFGHARFLPEGEQALTGEMGTYVYMAPEVISSEPYDEKCDIYSFSIILNELITGQHPYIETSFTPCEIAFHVVNGTLRPKLQEDDIQCKELIDLICCSWSGDASARPSFARITTVLRKIQAKLI